MKEHLPLLKETLKFMVNQLRADDRLSLISFDHEVSAKYNSVYWNGCGNNIELHKNENTMLH